jgi:2-polyprenyl-6-methoxyphenol hydroxylase-like FAD-dependent oxidoreductase
VPAVSSVLVVGGGTAGAASAILLAEAGVTVELVEAAREVSGRGSGITLLGNALRVLRRLGVWEDVRAAGYAFDAIAVRAPDRQGTLLAEAADSRTGGPDLPAALGMARPMLAHILLERAAAVGTKIRLGVACVGVAQDGEGVNVSFSDGSSARYDLVVAADGIRSTLRGALGIELQTRPTGVAAWRASLRRPAGITRSEAVFGGPAYIAGYCPTGEHTLYCFLLDDVRDDRPLTPQERLAAMRRLVEAYHGPWDELRELLTDPSTVNYTSVETHLLAPPWHRGRVVFIGDAVHACPPTLAQGAAQALEDAAVLAELLLARDVLDEQLWSAFTDRRYERARAIVRASVQMVQWMLKGEQGDVPGLMDRIRALVCLPA